MKRLIGVVLLLGLFGCADPEKEETAKKSQLNKEQSCVEISRYSTLIMKMRQSGMPIAEVLKSSENNPSNEMMKLIIKEAFKEPISTSERDKEIKANEFGSKQYLECAKHI